MVQGRIISVADKEWIQYWGPKANVFEKRLLTPEDGFPISLTLRRLPAQKQVQSEGGYVLHAHPALEIGYVIQGRGRGYFEDRGEIEIHEGMVLCQPAGLKHAGGSVDRELLILVINHPPYVKPIGPQPG